MDKLGDLVGEAPFPGINPISGDSSTAIKIYGQPGDCPDCGAANKLKDHGRCQYWMPSCNCLKGRQEEECRLEGKRCAEQARVERIAQLFDQAKLGPRFAERRFDTWEEREGTRYAFLAAMQYVEDWQTHAADGSGLLFFGPFGNGKSHLAAAIVNALIPQGVSAVFQSAPDLLRLFRSTYDEGSEVKESTLMSALAEVDLLVLDDIGAQKWSEYSEAQLYQVVDTRYRWKRPLIITTNLGFVKEPLLESYIGPRAMDRIIEMCDLIEDNGTSYRKAQALERIERTTRKR